MIRALAIGLGISTDTLIGLSEIENTPKRKYRLEKISSCRDGDKRMDSKGYGQSEIQCRRNSKKFIFEMGLQTGGASFRRTLKGEAATPPPITLCTHGSHE